MSAQAVLAPLANWAAGVPKAWSECAWSRAGAALADTVACMAAGAREPVGRKAAKMACGGPASLVGQAAAASPATAALVNAAAAHALDFDDYFSPARAHASAVVFPALLALGEVHRTPLADVLDGYIVGLEVMGRIGACMNPGHRAAGWHATSTLGALGAAAGCARLIGLEKAGMSHAVALAASRAGGSMAQFGSDAKAMHAGFAAEAGVSCAILAAAGVTAAGEPIAGPYGLAALMAGNSQAGIDEAAPGSRPLIESAGLKTKRYPNCASAHRAVDALLALRAEFGLRPADVERIDVTLPAVQSANLLYPNPQTPAQARFSLPFAMAAVLDGGGLGLADFSADRLASRSIQAVMRIVAAHPIETADVKAPTQVRVALKGGRSVSRSVTTQKGAPGNPLSAEDFAAKIRACTDASPLADRYDDIVGLADKGGAGEAAALMVRLRC